MFLRLLLAVCNKWNVWHSRVCGCGISSCLWCVVKHKTEPVVKCQCPTTHMYVIAQDLWGHWKWKPTNKLNAMSWDIAMAITSHNVLTWIGGWSLPLYNIEYRDILHSMAFCLTIEMISLLSETNTGSWRVLQKKGTDSETRTRTSCYFTVYFERRCQFKSFEQAVIGGRTPFQRGCLSYTS